MNSKYALVLAAVLGVIAAFAVQDHISKERKRLLDEVRPVKVVFAAEDVPAGTQLREGLLESRDWPSAYLTDQLIVWSDLEKNLVGKVASQRIAKGNPVFLDDVEVKKQEAPSATLLPGRRAFTISTDLITGVAGMITPGAHIDVLGHFRDQEAQASNPRRGPQPPAAQGVTTVAVLEDVPVLAVGAYGGRHWGQRGREADTTSVTVSVTPLQASLLAYAQKQGSLTLLLRRDGDREQAQPPAVDGRSFMPLVQQARGR